jgi:hypothetical protein
MSIGCALSDPLVPCQLARGPLDSPERALCRAMLLLVVVDLQQGADARCYLGLSRHQRARYRASAQAWLASDDASPFSCRWCCDVLGLDADRVRAALMPQAAA